MTVARACSLAQTAKIVVHMARGDGFNGPAFVFRRPTRGLDRNGYAFGSKASKEAREQANAKPSEAEDGDPADGGNKRQRVDSGGAPVDPWDVGKIF